MTYSSDILSKSVSTYSDLISHTDHILDHSLLKTLPASDRSSGNEYRLLLAGDNIVLKKGLQKFFTQFFAEQKLQISFVYTTDALIDVLGSQSFDLVLLQTGDDSAERSQDIAECISRKGCKLILLLRSQDDGVTLRQSAFGCLPIPYDDNDLLFSCRQVFRQLSLENVCADLNRSLEHARAMLRAITSSSSDLTYMLDRNGRFIFANDRLESILGYSHDGLIGRHYSTIIYKDDMELADRIFSDKGASGGLYRHTDIRLRTKINSDQAGPSSVRVDLTSNAIHTGLDTGEFIGIYGIARNTFERQPSEDSIQFQAHHDFLTKLPNRVLFRDRLGVAMSHARRNGEKLAVMFLDLDRFKNVNDTLGHPFGDRVLQTVATKLQSCLRKGDTLARFGGDEFTLLLSEIRSPQDVATIAEKITQQLSLPLHIDEHEVTIGASIGVALYPDSGDDIDDMVKHADIAMYHAKSSDKKKYHIFSSGDTRGGISDSNKLEQDLRTALDEDQFDAFYQPQVDLATGKITAVSVRARWNHPVRGLISPDIFSPVAEQTGLIMQINERVQARACEAVLNWRSEALPQVKLLFGLSAVQMMQKDFPDTLLGALKDSDIIDLVEIEVMEAVVMQNMESLAPKLRRLARAGIQIVLDRFGAAYFSLFQLQHFPISTLKIDRAFVREINGHEKALVIKGIIAMARTLGIQVVAEGVETSHQVEYLKKNGCDSVQGLFYGPPRSATEMTGLLRQQPWALNGEPPC